MSEPYSGPVLCIGELLWDVFPTDRHLGGAPPNVAVHLRALGIPAKLASRVGADADGDALCDILTQLGLATSLIQRDAKHATGRVQVDLADPLAPEYTIVQPAAWDLISTARRLDNAASRARAIVFGSLAQRDRVSRATIRSLLSPGPLRIFDVNLRPPFDDRQVVEDSLQLSDVVKLNDAEFETVRGRLGLPEGDRAACEALRTIYGLEAVCVTRGSKGAALLHDRFWGEHPGYPVEVVDTVGSGDAFLAALIQCLFHSGPDELGRAHPQRLLAFANAVGAFVATQRGATPPLDRDAVLRIMRLRPEGQRSRRAE